MSVLFFRVGRATGATAGTSSEKEECINIPVRELIQNAMDASPTKKQIRKITMDQIEVKTKQIPHLDKYEEVMELAETTLSDDDSFNDNADNKFEILRKLLKNDTTQILLCSDNGSGMDENTLKSMLDERSKNRNEGSTGSFGQGHLTAFWLSNIGYVLYASKAEGGGGELCFTGQASIAGHEDEIAEREPNGFIIKESPKDINKPNFKFLSSAPHFIAQHMPNFTHGTTVAILGLSENWDDDMAAYYIASNFFAAIIDQKFEVTLNDNMTINSSSIPKILESHSDDIKRNAPKSEIISGSEAWQCYNTIVEGDKHQFKLKNGDVILICLRQDPTLRSTLVLVRNGMLISRHNQLLSQDLKYLHKDDFVKYDIVIQVNNEHCPIYEKLVKRSENKYHNQLMKNNLSDEDYAMIIEIEKEIADNLKSLLTKVERKGYNLPLFKSYKISKKNPGSPSPTPTPLPVPPSPVPPVPPPPPPVPPLPPRPKPSVPNRALLCRHTSHYSIVNDKHVFEVQLYVEAMDRKDRVYLALAVAEDSDDNKFTHYANIIKINCQNEQSKKIKFVRLEDDDRQIEIHNIKAKVTYEFSVDISLPKEVEQSKILALNPMFGVRRKTTKS